MADAEAVSLIFDQRALVSGMNTPIRIHTDPLVASIAMVTKTSADVTIKQRPSVRISHPDLRLAVGVYLLDHNFTGNETATTRTLGRRDYPEQCNSFTDPARTLTKAQANKIRKESI